MHGEEEAVNTNMRIWASLNLNMGWGMNTSLTSAVVGWAARTYLVHRVRPNRAPRGIITSRTGRMLAHTRQMDDGGWLLMYLAIGVPTVGGGTRINAPERLTEDLLNRIAIVSGNERQDVLHIELAEIFAGYKDGEKTT